MSELFFDDFLRLRMSILMVQSMTRFFWIVARSEEHNLYILLDVNTEIYPIKRKGRVLLALSPFLVLNTKDGPVSIQEKFEYIMYGRLYDITADEILRSSPEVEVCASFGGLQLILRGDPSHGVKFAVDQKLFFFTDKEASSAAKDKSFSGTTDWTTSDRGYIDLVPLPVILIRDIFCKCFC